MRQPLRVGLVAGEASGDQLGAALIAALRARMPDVQCFGVAGPKMLAQGCAAWEKADQLAVMGLAEVLRHLPRLLRLRARLVARFLAARPHVFVGIDAPEFNLGLARRLKRTGIPTVQYVSPQVWAWREGRVRTMGNAVDLVLCLLPFEADFYARHGVRARFVGHPLADQIPLAPDRAAARAALGIGADVELFALLPGSRVGEVERLAGAFLDAAAAVAARRPHARFIAPMASPAARRVFESFARRSAVADRVRIVDGDAHRVLAASDAVLVASGTATLETLLSKRPMAVAYRMAALTAFAVRRLVKVPYFSQPNLLVGRRLVPEFFQDEVRGEALAASLLGLVGDPAYLDELQREFHRVHETLRRGGAKGAADAILALPGVITS
ncbi:MAG: lipid-A-disaccharide synthase [Gammaproteobacteria bacterium]